MTQWRAHSPPTNVAQVRSSSRTRRHKWIEFVVGSYFEMLPFRRLTLLRPFPQGILKDQLYPMKKSITLIVVVRIIKLICIKKHSNSAARLVFNARPISQTANYIFSFRTAGYALGFPPYRISN